MNMCWTTLPVYAECLCLMLRCAGIWNTYHTINEKSKTIWNHELLYSAAESILAIQRMLHCMPYYHCDPVQEVLGGTGRKGFRYGVCNASPEVVEEAVCCDPISSSFVVTLVLHYCLLALWHRPMHYDCSHQNIANDFLPNCGWIQENQCYAIKWLQS